MFVVLYITCENRFGNKKVYIGIYIALNIDRGTSKNLFNIKESAAELKSQ